MAIAGKPAWQLLSTDPPKCGRWRYSKTSVGVTLVEYLPARLRKQTGVLTKAALKLMFIPRGILKLFTRPKGVKMLGDLESQLQFASRHKLLIDNCANLKAVADAAFSECDKSTFEAMALYTLARVAMEDDFWSILLLCANGYPHSAKQVLRGMFERVVTLSYLTMHPEEIPLFNDFFAVDQYKRLRRHDDNEPGKGSDAFREETKKRYEKVKENYMITDCRKCGTRRLNHMWSKKNLPSMAKEVGFSFKTIEDAYYIPLEEAHPKIDALFNRTKEGPEGSVSYDERPDIKEGDITVMTAAILQMKALEVMRNFFKIANMQGPLGPYLAGLSKYITEMRHKIRDGDK
jgi:Family of unknown function (DUF5677)